jgi:hypothetical protein
MAAPHPRPSARGVLGEMARVLRDHWAALLPAAIVIFVPVGLLETLDADLQDKLGDTGDALSAVELISVTLLHTASALLGQILFAGLISALATHGRDPGLRGLAGLARELPIGRLILADLAFVLVVTGGLIALIVPGLVFLVWFALIGPVIEVERAGVRRAFGRSRELVRRRFWLVAGFVLPITLFEQAISELIQSASTWSLGDNFLSGWAAGSLNNLASSTLLALAVTVLYLELSAAGTSPRTPPEESRPARRERAA